MISVYNLFIYSRLALLYKQGQLLQITDYTLHHLLVAINFFSSFF